MENTERTMAREKMDRELRFYRLAGKKQMNYPHWLRRVRQALGVSTPEMARDLGVNRSVIFRLEKSEGQRTISLKALDRVAGAMGCKLVYGIVPRQGQTLVELAEWRRWMKKASGQ